MDGDDPYTTGYTTAADATRQDQDQEIATLAQFMSRPIKILNLGWNNATTQGTFNPWSLFFNDKRVANRLTNYNLLRATLKVKFVINGNIFFMGRMIVGYAPFCPSDSVSNYSFAEDVVQLSQLPHIFINPTTSEGGIITCPFFFNKNYVNVPAGEYNLLGNMYYNVLNSLNHATQGADFSELNISVFAWAEEVQLSVITSRDKDTLIPQSGEIETANKSGIVSGPATSIARVANALANIPAITPYAKATELAFNTISKIASSFGYCRPSVTKTADFVRIIPSSSFALTNTPDLSLKLSVDHKQESTVDPRVAGIMEEDMLSIVNIAKRESYIGKCIWADTDITDDMIWNCRVTPCIWVDGANDAYHFPATAMAALPFRYWTGTLNYRFQVVCSGFHKGRLAVSWDPNFHASDVPEYNIMYTEIVDIAETQDFTVSIANGQEVTLIRNAIPGVTTLPEIVGLFRFTNVENFANGVIALNVINALTFPDSTVHPFIEINTYISAGDDFKVFVPWDHFQNFVATQPVSAALLAADETLEEQSGTLVGSNDDSEDSPQKPDKHVLFDDSTADMTNLVYTGESIPSFRAMLKRYSLWRTILGTPSATTIRIGANFKFAIYPFQRGRYGNAPDLAVGSVNYAFCNMLLLHWVTYAFSGFRGNFRYKVVPRCMFDTTSSSHTLSVQRFSSEVTNTEYAAPNRFFTPTFIADRAAARTALRVSAENHDGDFSNTGTQGMAWITTNSSNMLEFEVPFYSQFRFAGTRHHGWTQADTWGLGGYYLQVKGAMNNTQVFDIYAAAGEDFQPYFFIGLPKMYYEPTPPAVLP